MVFCGSISVNAIPQDEDQPVDGRLSPEVKEFIDKYFHHSRVESFESEDGGSKFDIKLSDGYEIEIKSDGQWENIEAPAGAVMPVNLVKKFLPRKSYDYLVNRGVADKVEKLSFDFNRGFEVDVAGQGSDMNFTRTGLTK